VDDLARWASFRLVYLGKRHIFMRYRRGHISISDAKDVPLLLTIRNARAITYDQICSLAQMDGIEASKRIVHWRLSRLERSGLVQRMKHDLLFSQPSFRSPLRALRSSNRAVIRSYRCPRLPGRSCAKLRSCTPLNWPGFASPSRRKAF
jgi:hypothetical protein